MKPLVVALVFMLFTSTMLPFVLYRAVELSNRRLLRQRSETKVNAKPLSPLEQLNNFLRSYPETSAAKFVHLLRNLHSPEPAAEALRINACHANNRTTLCVAGEHSQHEEHDTTMPLSNGDPTFSVYRMLHFRDTDKKIANLATQVACLPLYLAGAAVVEDAIMVELGPFAGLSSLCIVAGLRVAAHGVAGPHTYRAYDTFTGAENYHSIVARAGWVKKRYPVFSAENSSFLELWKDTVYYQ